MHDALKDLPPSILIFLSLLSFSLIQFLLQILKDSFRASKSKDQDTIQSLSHAISDIKTCISVLTTTVEQLESVVSEVRIDIKEMNKYSLRIVQLERDLSHLTEKLRTMP